MQPQDTVRKKKEGLLAFLVGLKDLGYKNVSTAKLRHRDNKGN
jgi:hypothetical protein